MCPRNRVRFKRVKPARSRDAGNTMLSKEFAGGILIMTGANSAVGLRSPAARKSISTKSMPSRPRPTRKVIRVTLAGARSLTLAQRRNVLLVSTPTIRGLSRIEREYEASDQRRFFVPCPHCGHVQWLKFERLRWEVGQPETAEYHCEGCEAPIAEHNKTATTLHQVRQPGQNLAVQGCNVRSPGVMLRMAAARSVQPTRKLQADPGRQAGNADTHLRFRAEFRARLTEGVSLTP